HPGFVPIPCSTLFRSGTLPCRLCRERSGASQPSEAGAADGEDTEARSGYPGYRNRRTYVKKKPGERRVFYYQKYFRKYSVRHRIAIAWPYGIEVSGIWR